MPTGSPFAHSEGELAAVDSYTALLPSTHLPLPHVQVGGRLCFFTRQWFSLTQDNWIREVISQGYCLELVSQPPLGIVRTTPAGDRDGPLQLEVLSLLRKKAIEPVPLSQRGTGFYSTFFLRPKKTGGLRPILNLRPLNQHLTTRHFRMDHLASIVADLRTGLWGVSLDLTDAYLHIPVRTAHKKFLRFALSTGEHYQFTCLCFGLRTAPRVFTKVVTEIGALLRQEGATIYQYLDDWLLVNSDRDLLHGQLCRMAEVVTRL